MALESASGGWEERERRHKYRQRSPELNLNRSLNHQEYEDDDEREEWRERRARRENPSNRRHAVQQQQFMDRKYAEEEEAEEEMEEADRRGGPDRRGTRREMIALDLNVGQTSPEGPPYTNSRRDAPSPPLAPPRRERSDSRSPAPTAAAGDRRKSPPLSPPSRKRSSRRKQGSPISRQQPGSSPSPKRGRHRSPPLVERRQKQRQYSESPVRRRRPSEESAGEAQRLPSPDPQVTRRSVTPLKRSSPSLGHDPEKPSALDEERGRRRSVSPSWGFVPSPPEPTRRSSSIEADGMRRSVTPLRRRPSPGPSGRKRSRSPPSRGGSRRSAGEDVVRRKEPIHSHKGRSRSRSPPLQRSPSPVPHSRRMRSPAGRRRSPRRSPRRERSPRRSPRRERSPRGRGSPRRRSPPGRYRGSGRRDRRSSPSGRREWSPVQNRSNGVGKPGNNLFIAGFNFITTERDLERKFSRYGRVMDVRIVRDKRSGESRGFGFLTLERDEDADAAIKTLDQTEWNGRIVLVEKAKTPTRF